jgi:hypothetical protein
MARASAHDPSAPVTGRLEGESEKAGGPAGAPLEAGRPVSASDLARRADWIRLETIDLVDRAGLGHYSSTFSCAEILAVL